MSRTKLHRHNSVVGDLSRLSRRRSSSIHGEMVRRRSTIDQHMGPLRRGTARPTHATTDGVQPVGLPRSDTAAARSAGDSGERLRTVQQSTLVLVQQLAMQMTELGQLIEVSLAQPQAPSAVSGAGARPRARQPMPAIAEAVEDANGSSTKLLAAPQLPPPAPNGNSARKAPALTAFATAEPTPRTIPLNSTRRILPSVLSRTPKPAAAQPHAQGPGAEAGGAWLGGAATTVHATTVV